MDHPPCTETSRMLSTTASSGAATWIKNIAWSFSRIRNIDLLRTEQPFPLYGVLTSESITTLSVGSVLQSMLTFAESSSLKSLLIMLISYISDCCVRDIY